MITESELTQWNRIKESQIQETNTVLRMFKIQARPEMGPVGKYD